MEHTTQANNITKLHLLPSVPSPKEIRQKHRTFGLLSLAFILLVGQFVFSLLWLEMGFGRTLVTPSHQQAAPLQYVEFAEEHQRDIHLQHTPSENQLVLEIEDGAEKRKNSIINADEDFSFRPAFTANGSVFLSIPSQDLALKEVGPIEKIDTGTEMDLFVQRRVQFVDETHYSMGQTVTLYSLDNKVCEARLENPYNIVRAVTFQHSEQSADEIWDDFGEDKTLAFNLTFDDLNCANAVWGHIGSAHHESETTRLEEVYLETQTSVLSKLASTAEYQAIQKQFEMDFHTYSLWHEEPYVHVSVKELGLDTNIYVVIMESPGCGDFDGTLSAIWNSKTNQWTYFEEVIYCLDIVRAIDVDNDGVLEWMGVNRDNDLLLFKINENGKAEVVVDSPNPYLECTC